MSRTNKLIVLTGSTILVVGAWLMSHYRERLRPFLAEMKPAYPIMAVLGAALVLGIFLFHRTKSRT